MVPSRGSPTRCSRSFFLVERTKVSLLLSLQLASNATVQVFGPSITKLPGAFAEPVQVSWLVYISIFCKWGYVMQHQVHFRPFTNLGRAASITSLSKLSKPHCL